MSEQQLYKDYLKVTVTSARFIVGKTTYPISDITSSTIGTTKGNRSKAVIMFLIGLFLLFFQIFFNGQYNILPFDLLATLGMLMLGFGFFSWLDNGSFYTVRISLASGEVDAVKDKSKDTIIKINNAVNKAITQRGQINITS